MSSGAGRVAELTLFLSCPALPSQQSVEISTHMLRSEWVSSGAGYLAQLVGVFMLTAFSNCMPVFSKLRRSASVLHYPRTVYNLLFHCPCMPQDSQLVITLADGGGCAVLSLYHQRALHLTGVCRRVSFLQVSGDPGIASKPEMLSCAC